VYKHYSGEAENVYMILQQIYSGNSVSNFIRTDQKYLSFIEDITRTILVSFFPGHTV